MTEAERKAMKWLEAMQHGGGIFPEAVHDLCRTLKAMLARPVLPDTIDDELVEAIWWACEGSMHREVAEKIIGAIRIHLTAPKTKEFEVEWWGVMRRDHTIDGVYACEANAKHHASGFGYTVVRLTGKATVPA